jgi:hypothetical protein
MVVSIVVAGASMALTWDWIKAFQSTPEGLVDALVVLVVVVGVVVVDEFEVEVELLTVMCHVLGRATGRLRTADPRDFPD